MTWTFFVLIISCTFYSNGLAFPDDGFCCAHTSGSCKSACEQMTKAAVEGNMIIRERKFKAVTNYCPPTLAPFWLCMNKTVSEMRSGDSWSGRHCCHIAQSRRCQRSCVLSSNDQSIDEICRKSDELEFYYCLDRQEEGDRCCGQARSSDCHHACLDVFRKSLHSHNKRLHSQQREAVEESCSESSPRVLECVANHTKVSPASNTAKYLHCCDKNDQEECRVACKNILKSQTTFQDILDALEQNNCGPPLPHDKFWQCFLHNPDHNQSSHKTSHSHSKIDLLGIDSAKLHCCSRSVSSICRKLCVETFSIGWSKNWQEFDQNCLSSTVEQKLASCVEEVEEPCELGCDGLNFCTNWNNRPDQLFRACTAEADEAARHDYESWVKKGYLMLPRNLKIPVKNVSKCRPDWWKGVACAMQIKPCHSDLNANRICRKDCFELLTDCVDWSRMDPGETVASLCSRLTSWEPGVSCVSLSTFLEPNSVTDLIPLLRDDHVTAPCKQTPCDLHEVCRVNRNCLPGSPCQSYHCFNGCRLGHASHFMTPRNEYMRLPVLADGKGCFQICQCSDKGLIDKCQPLPCVTIEDCWIGNRKIDHGSTFYSDCNVCSCFAGEITCSKKQCFEKNKAFRTLGNLPCDCPNHYVPSCGRNGKTFPSACLARCWGLADIDFSFGSCSEKDSCSENPCPSNLTCVPQRKICLSLWEKSCPDYVCVDGNINCSKQPYLPVCDTEQQEHRNLCYLIRANKRFAYNGPCLVGCRSKSGPVCGINGETYASECAAWADFSLVDYEGACNKMGLITDQAIPACPKIRCPLQTADCLGTTPPGACCPVCGGALRILISSKQVDRALYATQKSLTLHNLLASLQNLISTAECSIRGHLTVEKDLFVVVKAKTNSTLQSVVCVKEAEKIMRAIRGSSPHIVTDIGLSALVAAVPAHTLLRVASSTSSIMFRSVYFSCMILCLQFLKFFN